MKVIGLMGQARSGKSTVGNYLEDKHGFVQLAFADPVKDMLEMAFPHMEFRHGDRSEVNHILGVSPRRMMQTLGTEWGRKQINPGIWVSHMHQRLNELQRKGVKKVVVTDIRYTNELEGLWEWGAEILYIQRAGLEKLNHDSEDLDVSDPAIITLDNNDTLEHLYRSVEKVIGGEELANFMDQVRSFSGEVSPSLCVCDHKLQNTGAVFYQSMKVLQCSNCNGWQQVRKPIQ